MKRIYWIYALILCLLLAAAGCSREPAVTISTESRGDSSSAVSPAQTVPDSGEQETGTDPAVTAPSGESSEDPAETETESETGQQGRDPDGHTRGVPTEEAWTTAETTEPAESGETDPSGEPGTDETGEPSESTDPSESESGTGEEPGTEAGTEEPSDPPVTEEPTAAPPSESAEPTAAPPATAAPTEAPPAPTLPTGETPELTGERLPGIDYDSYLPVPEWVGRGTAHGSLAMQYGGYYTKDSWAKVIYLTFCMDYENGYTNQMMDTLAAKGVQGTFFITGTYLANRPDMARAILSRGHLLGSHSYRHRYTSELSDVTLINDLVLSRRLFANTLGYNLQYYRPAYGAVTERDLYLAQRMGLTTVMFSFYYRDFDLSAQPGYWEALEKLKSGLQPGAVYYLHVTPCNIAALPDFIDYARNQGYTFLRIDQSGSGATEPYPSAPPTEAPPTEAPPTEAPPTEAPSTEPVTEEPVTEEPVTEEPVTEEPVTEEPATEEPVTEDPGTEEQPGPENPETEEAPSGEEGAEESGAETEEITDPQP